MPVVTGCEGFPILAARVVSPIRTVPRHNTPYLQLVGSCLTPPRCICCKMSRRTSRRTSSESRQSVAHGPMWIHEVIGHMRNRPYTQTLAKPCQDSGRMDITGRLHRRNIPAESIRGNGGLSF